MKFAHRLAYYLGGFAIGLILLFFFLGGKKASCDYSPDARVLKNIRIKKRIFSSDALTDMNLHDIDTADISALLQNGDVDFSKSNTKQKPCKAYYIEGETKEKNVGLFIENCEETATIQKIDIIPN